MIYWMSQAPKDARLSSEAAEAVRRKHRSRGAGHRGVAGSEGQPSNGVGEAHCTHFGDGTEDCRTAEICERVPLHAGGTGLLSGSENKLCIK